MTHITLIDKDRSVLSKLSALLRDEGYRVESHTDPVRALQAMKRRPTSLAVMDMKMPRMDGISMLERLGSEEALDIPVVFLSGESDHADEVMALRMGAEDYLHKPFSGRVLVERLNSALRRAEKLRNAVGDPGAGKRKPLTRGGLEMNPETMRVSWKGMDVRLTATEFETLYCIALKPDHVRSRQVLMDHIYGVGIYVEERSIDSHVKRIRKKIRAKDPEFAAIETLYGVGYRLLVGAA